MRPRSTPGHSCYPRHALSTAWTQLRPQTGAEVGKGEPAVPPQHAPLMSQAVSDTEHPVARAASSVEGAFAITLLAAIAASAIASPAADIAGRFAQPAAVALVLAVAFWLRPVSALLALVIFVLGYDTLALYVGNTVKQTD